MKYEVGETNPPNPHNPPPSGSDGVGSASSRGPRRTKRNPPAGRKRYSGQYHAGDDPGSEMRDIGPAARRSRLRTVVGDWELNQAYAHALAADDERERRSTMRLVSMLPPDGANEAALDGQEPSG